MEVTSIESTNNQSRATIIVGAGAPLDFTLPAPLIKPSTWNITQEVIKPYSFPSITLTVKTVQTVKKIYDCLMRTFPAGRQNDWKSFEKPKPEINFEQLFHVLEMYQSFDRPWNRKCFNPDVYPEFAPFTKRRIKLDQESLHYVTQEFIHRIMVFVSQYDTYFRDNIETESWYRDFFRAFEGKSDIFTFNYDTTIENSLKSYEDGYEQLCDDEDFQRFNPNKLWENPHHLTTVNHLHGCINYFFETAPEPNRLMSKYTHGDMCKYDSFDKVNSKWMGRGWSNTATQSGDEYFPSPIITGLRKTDKLVGVPFDFYHGRLYDSILHSNKLIIIGYSFGDLYVNQLLKRMDLIHGDKKRIILIDYWNNKNSYTDSKGNKVESEDLDLDYFCENKINHEMVTFIMMMSGITNTGQLKQSFGSRYPKVLMVSSNNNMMILPKKFKEATKYMTQIEDFLYS